MSKDKNNGKSVNIPEITKPKKKVSASQENPARESFTAGDFTLLSVNENSRYLSNSKSGKVGHAVIKTNKNGDKIAQQYTIPCEENGLSVRPLENIEAISRFGKTRYRAQSPNGTRMYAKRSEHAHFNHDKTDEELEIGYFSPSEKEDKEPFWGIPEKSTSLFRTNLTDEQKEELAEIKTKQKGGKALSVDPESVLARDGNKRRKPDQNTVMGESAKDAYEGFMDSMMDELSNEAKFNLKRAIDAPLRDAFYGNYRPEWLHAEGFSLTPLTIDPQRRDNLGAAPKWSNTEMMVLERIAKWFALHKPATLISIKPLFTMLLDSELIEKIEFEVKLEQDNKSLTFHQDINPFQKFPLFRKATDLSQGTAIANSLLEGIKPVSEQKVLGITPLPLKNSTAAISFVKPKSKIIITKPEPIKVTRKKPFVSIETEPFFATKASKKSIFPTEIKYEKSLVRVDTTAFEPEYDEPWLGSHVQQWHGTGLVVAHQGKMYILTNAHCVQNSRIVRVRLANHKERFETERKCVSYQCDLALLEVTDPKFAKLAQPVELGDMVRLEDKVQIVGFPMGGDEISISKGITSRIEVRDYCMSGLDMLQVQIDAAVNPGNSGGPIFSNGKVVGVAFQGYDRQGLGYMIPIPIIKHFLTEAFNGLAYRGFPELPIAYQFLENPTLREYYGMKKNQTGIRVRKVDNLSDAFIKLQEDDILLAIDSFKISNTGTVDVPGIGNCIDMCHVMQMKFIGDSVDLKILRKNPVNGNPQVININVILDHVPLETEKVPQNEYDKMPTYFIASGISFMPLTRNYVEGKGTDLEEVYLLEDGCSLINAPKKNPDEQIVIINEVFDCKETDGYGSYENTIVKSVNGKSINNIKDVIVAIESNKNATHVILTAGKKVMAVKNMSSEEHQKLLNLYNITKDRSDDLLPPGQAPLPNKTAPIKIKKPESNRRQDEFTWDEMVQNSATPGKLRYLSRLEELEQKYQDLGENEDMGMNIDDLGEGDDEVLDAESLGSDTEDTIECTQESDSEDESISYEESQSMRGSSLFQNKRKRVLNSSEEENEHDQKRFRL